MPTVERNGVCVTLPESLRFDAPPSGHRHPPSADIFGEHAALLGALSQQGLVAVEEFAAVPVGQALADDEQIKIRVDLNATEKAVVLTEREGYYAWHFSDEVSVRTATITATINIPLQPIPVPPSMRQQRGVIGDVLFESVKIHVLKLVSSAARAITSVEPDFDKRLVVISNAPPDQWRTSDTVNGLGLSVLSLLIGEPRILLFIHDTFSNTAGSFGMLGHTPWGQALLESARQKYTAVIGYDHPTLGEDPLENAQDLLRRLTTDSVTPLQIDTVCFGRGALVFRALTERLLAGPGSNPRFGRVIHVAGADGGTPLAEPANWHTLIDLHTNLSVSTARALQMISPARRTDAVLRGMTRGLGALVKQMAAAAGSKDGVPGLAAMEPDGAFIGSLNQTQPQSSLSQVDAYTISSSFKARIAGTAYEPKELPARLVLRLVNGVMDRLIGRDNDLVVSTDPTAGDNPGPLEGANDAFDFGENSVVYHTVYFSRPETANALARWLNLAKAPEAGHPSSDTTGGPAPWTPGVAGSFGHAAPPAPAAVDTDVSVVDVNDSVESVFATLEREHPSYLVINGGYPQQSLNYALPAEEFLDLSQHSSPGQAVGRVLGLRESDAAPTLSRTQAATRGTTRGARSRHVVVDAGHPIGVAPATTDLPSSAGLGELAQRIESPRNVADRILARRSMPTFAPDVPTFPTRAQGNEVICHFHADMESELAINTIATVNVIVSREAIERTIGAISASGSAAPSDPERPITIQVIPRAQCEVVGNDRVEVPLPAPGEPHSLFFDIRPTHVGEGSIWVLARQGPMPLVTLKLAPHFVQQRRGAARRTTAEATSSTAPPLLHPVHEIRIREQRQGGETVYVYDVELPSADIIKSYQSRPFTGDRSDYVDNLYREIETRHLHNIDDEKNFQADLRAFGIDLLTQLIPDELQRVLWKHREKIDSIVVLSDEPFIPWELVHLKDPDTQGLPEETLFLGQMGLVRWLYDIGTAPLQLRLDKARYVIPEYLRERDRLPETAAEKAFLEARFGATAVEPQPGPVREILRQPGAFDLLHFAAHCGAEHGDIANAQLKLQGRRENDEEIDAYLSATIVRAYANLQADGGPRPMVVLNACQSGRSGFRLTGLGGFAEAFLSGRAGAFVGSLWSVGDYPARTFIQAFYTELLNDKSLAEAAKLAREAAKEANDSTWLAYAVYGHPHAHVVVAASAPDQHERP